MSRRAVISLPGCVCFEGAPTSPRAAAADTWLVMTADHSRPDVPVHFTLESKAQVDARRAANASACTMSEGVVLLGLVRFLGGAWRATPVHRRAWFWVVTRPIAFLSRMRASGAVQ